MLNLFQHRIVYEVLKQVQDDVEGKYATDTNLHTKKNLTNDTSFNNGIANKLFHNKIKSS